MSSRTPGPSAAEGSAPLRVLSLGAGVQSSTLLLMAIAGEFGEPPDCAIFADTGWEPPQVYRHLEQLERLSSIPIVRVTAGNLRTDTLGAFEQASYFKIPLHVRGRAAAMMRRQCTRDYKLRPIRTEAKRRLGRRPRPGDVEMWIGISLDEVGRMKDSGLKWCVNRWPLIERRMTRRDCELWLSAHGHATPPRSACVGCPFHSTEGWRRVRADPEQWADALEFDERIRTHAWVEGELFLHRSGRPLADVDLASAAELGQGDLFGAECEGLCGV